MLRVHRRRRSVAARIRKALAAALADQPRDAEATAADPATAEAEPVTEAAPELPRREHLFGSQYTVRMTFDELMATRGYTGEQVLQQRRRLVAPSDGQRQRDAATRRAGYVPGEVLWPSE